MGNFEGVVHRTAVPAAFAAILLLLAGSTQPSRSAAPSPGFVYEAPAGQLQAGPLNPNDPYQQVLPSGRIVRPAGKSVVVGMNALGFAVSPNGRFAIVSNDDQAQSATVSSLDGASTGGFTLAVVDTGTMAVVDRYKDSKHKYFAGVVALKDPAHPSGTLVLASGGGNNVVYAFDLDESGHLTPDERHAIAMPTPSDPKVANNGKAFPSTIVLAPDHAHAYVVNNLGNDVVALDTRTRSTVGAPVDVGFLPFGAALSKYGLLVANEGLTNYSVLASPAPAPPFENVSEDPRRASSLSVVTIDRAGNPSRVSASVELDRRPDGLRNVGGAHPAAIAAMKNKPYAFVAMANVDRVATVALGRATPSVVGGTELRLFDRGPYGTQPVALALAETNTRLYVALAGINAIAVLDVSDPVRPHRLGLIPTGWYPSALTLSPDGKYLYVVNAKGFSHDRNFTGANPIATGKGGHIFVVDADSHAVWATFERIDLGRLNLSQATRQALSYLRSAHVATNDAIVPHSPNAPASPIKHVVLILEENKTFDSMLGDLTDASGNPYGPGDPSLVSYDKTITPNLHALASAFGLAGNIFADAEESNAGHQFVNAGIASDYSERTLAVSYARNPLTDKNEDPEDYPRAGYIFNNLAEHGKTYRDYGDLLRVSGYDEGENKDPKADDPNFAGPQDQFAPTKGLGGLYRYDAPALAALKDHVDLNYPGWNVRIRDTRRAAEFLRDFDPLVKADRMPDFTHIWLPADHGYYWGSDKDVPPIPEEVADGDRALGQIVEYLTHAPQWSSTVIFIMPDDAQATRDHVNEHRTYAIVVSPYAKRHYLGMRHLSTVSVLKTEEEILGLPPLSLGDLLATDMADFFTPTPDPATYTHIDVPVQTASAQGNRIAALLLRTDQSGPDADPRATRIIGLSREADKLTKQRGSMPPGAYARAQRLLYERALAAVSDSFVRR
jgi:DNA-binding beta-propeller fold protein YncE